MHASELIFSTAPARIVVCLSLQLQRRLRQDESASAVGREWKGIVEIFLPGELHEETLNESRTAVALCFEITNTSVERGKGRKKST